MREGIFGMDSQKEDSRAIGWTDGTNLYGKKRWNIIFYPYSSPTDCLSLFAQNPPKNITVVKNLGSAFATAQTLHGIVPSKELLNALPNGAEGQVTDIPSTPCNTPG